MNSRKEGLGSKKNAANRLLNFKKSQSLEDRSDGIKGQEEDKKEFYQMLFEDFSFY